MNDADPGMARLQWIIERDFNAAEAYAAGIRREYTATNPDQAGFARAVFTDQSMRFTTRDGP
jgi:hypothetical protein